MQPRVLTYLVVAGSVLAYTWGYGPRSLALATAAPGRGRNAGVHAGAIHSTALQHVLLRPVACGSVPEPQGQPADRRRRRRAVRPRRRLHAPRDQSVGAEARSRLPQWKETHDLAVLDPTGREDLAMERGTALHAIRAQYAASTRERRSHTRSGGIAPLGRGSFVAVGDLTSVNYPIESRTAFTLP